MFSTSTIQKLAYSNKGTHITISRDKLKVSKVSVVAAVSTYYGLEGLVINKTKINERAFCQIIHGIRKQGIHFALFMDNADTTTQILLNKNTEATCTDDTLQPSSLPTTQSK